MSDELPPGITKADVTAFKQEIARPEAVALFTDRVQEGAVAPVAVLTSIVEALGLKMDTPNGLRDVFDRIEQLKTREQELLTMLVRTEFAAPPPPENVLSASMASGLLLTLKAECEAQKARADAAEAAVAALHARQNVNDRPERITIMDITTDHDKGQGTRELDQTAPIDLAAELPPPGVLISDCSFLRGLRVVSHGWERVDGLSLLRCDDGTYRAMYMFELRRDKSNDAPRRPAPTLQPDSQDQNRPF